MPQLTPTQSLLQPLPLPISPLRLLILRALILTGALLLLCECSRYIMLTHYVPKDIQQSHLKDISAMWFMGLRLDMRSIGIAMLIFIIIEYIANVCRKIFLQLTGGGAERKYRICWHLCVKCCTFLPKCYAFLLGFVFMVASIVNFYYFRTYGNKIDVFIFGFKDDDTLAIIKIIWQDYPLIIGIISAVASGIVTLYLYSISPRIYRYIWRIFPFHRFLSKANVPLQIIGQLLLIIGFIISARGSLGTFPLRESEHYVSTLPIFNHLATNPLIALNWAFNNYKADAHFSPPSAQEGQRLQNALFPLLRQSADSVFLEQNPPHVVLNLMESFGSNMLMFDDEQRTDLLGSLRKHFEKDFVFFRFLSGANGTAPSFAALFFESPNAQISLGTSKNIKLPYNPFAIYANAGYEVIYITSGYGAWHGLGAFITTQGAHHIYDAIYLLEHFPQSKADKSTYGVPDEYAYKLAFEILKEATKPTFIAILTTSNHPPYHLPRTYTPKPLSLPQALESRIEDTSRQKFTLAITLYQYANNAFGDFMDNIKDSILSENTIVAASGDHRLRDLTENPHTDKALFYAVPLYMYVPPKYATQAHYEPLRVGSHKDILPTLYELSLSNAAYMSMGGRNILAKNDNPLYAFGYNSSVWIDEKGIYPIPTQSGYEWADSIQNLPSPFMLLSTDKTFTLDEKHKDFATLYKELFNYAIASRIFKVDSSADSVQNIESNVLDSIKP